MMTPEDRSDLKLKILEEIDKQKRLIDSLGETAKPVVPDDSIGRLTRMEAINDRSISIAALNSARYKLAGLERTMTKVDQPGFGYCVECNNPIPSGRILVVPESPLCIPCAENKSRKTAI